MDSEVKKFVGSGKLLEADRARYTVVTGPGAYELGAGENGFLHTEQGRRGGFDGLDFGYGCWNCFRRNL